MRIEFPRGFGPYQAGRAYDMADRLAELHVRYGRARPVVGAPAAAASEPKPAAPPARLARRR